MTNALELAYQAALNLQLAMENNKLKQDLATAVEALKFYTGPYKGEDSYQPGLRHEFGCGCCAYTIDAEGEPDYDSDVQGLTAREALAKIEGKE